MRIQRTQNTTYFIGAKSSLSKKLKPQEITEIPEWKIELARRIKRASENVEKLYASDEFRNVILPARRRYMQSVEAAIEKHLNAPIKNEPIDI